MRKLAIFALTMFLAAYTYAQDVKVTHNLPASASAGETINAEFTVTKGNIGAFAKFQCDVPAGTQVAVGDSKSGNFTFENNRAKIVWVSLPGDATFVFTLKITLSSSASGPQNFTSQFYYLENNVKKEYDIPAHTISVGGGAATTTPTTTPTETVATTTTPTSTPTETTSTTSTPTTTPTETTTTTSTATTTPTETVVTTPTVTPVETKTVTPVETKTTTPTSTAKAGVTYYVQVAALSTDPGLQYKKYGKMKVVVESGMYKVLIGTHSTLEDARKHKADLIGQGLVGSFVVAYENGVRIKI